MHENFMKGMTAKTAGGIAQNNKNGHKSVTPAHGGTSKLTGTGKSAAGKLKHFSKVAIKAAAAKAGKATTGVR